MNTPQTSHRTDRLLALATVGLVIFGLSMVYSSSSVVASLPPFSDPTYFVRRQFMNAVLGFIGLTATLLIDYKTWQKWAGWMLVGTFILLISVFAFSRGEINGAHRWIDIGPIHFQPSELAKFTLITYASAWFVRQKEEIGSITRTFLPFLTILAAVSFLMLRQPDLGTLILMLVPLVAIFYVAGITWKQMAIGALVIVMCGGLLFSSPYRRARVLTFMNPNRDPAGASYHVKNIEIAVGSGGWLGLGFGQSRQKRAFLPEPYTDSIFAVITEELGFLRATFLITVFMFVIYRGFRIAMLSEDPFAKYMATGITSWFGFQALINLAAMLHLIPLVGVPLPFVSFGGTNLIISLTAMGVLLNISRYAIDKLPREARAKRAMPMSRSARVRTAS